MKMIRPGAYIGCLVPFLLCFSALALSVGKDFRTVEDVYGAYPDRVERLFTFLDLDRAGLEKVKSAVKNNDYVRAGEELLIYYRRKPLPRFVRQEIKTEEEENLIHSAKEMLEDVFIFYQQRAKVPRNIQGMLQWDFKGPSEDQEWAWALNRHYPLQTLYDAHLLTNEPAYAMAMDAFIKDWVIQSVPYPGKKSATAMWRGLEVSFRVKSWTDVFYGLLDSGYFTDATRLLMLSSLPDHAHYARNFHGQNNWLTMEMSGLAKLSAAWPEFKDSRDWMAYAKSTMTESLADQIYPDGAQTELTSSYHQVSLNNFDQFRQIVEEVGEDLPEGFLTQLESMWNYIAYTIRPDGYGLLNNDADKKHNRNAVLTAAAEYGRPDWQYIASNGLAGERPKGPPSIVFPYAGHLISRSGYKKDAHWSFFDIGPWGTGHQHNDKLHVSIAAFGRDLLVDAGRFAYRGDLADKFRPYALGSASHNVLLIDGNGQGPGLRKTEKPLGDNQVSITDAYDYAWESFSDFENMEGHTTHQRTLFYLRDKFWIILDKVISDRPRQINALWHWHPDCEVERFGRHLVKTLNDHGNLYLQSLSSIDWQLDQVKGQEEPVVQGWYSEEYNKVEPNTVSIFTAEVDRESTLIWFILPYETEQPDVQAEVISEDSYGVSLRITVEDETWHLEIPFKNTNKISVEQR
ncbi:alginate lyase family protein [Negadavirga shengliensis]|uniref:Alginate lyase family protein n=1 Tax=Negadavirga shengliensis TaxID=1389218 RepID=A0ABV9SXI4_9BACT